ncbi:MAG: sulfotransferase domain-containing protein [Rubrobacter sp.]
MVFRFDTALETTHGKRAFLRIEGGVERVAIPGYRQPHTLPEPQGHATTGPKAAPNTVEQSRKRQKGSRAAGASGQAVSGGRARRKATRPDTTRKGALPDFTIIGAQKCGTSSLYHLLRRHPNVEPSRRKEIHYFDIHFDKGIGWYKSHFTSASRGVGRKVISGESSPYYLFHPHAPKRMAAAVPGVKLIVLLRNPVDRAYSHYQAAARHQRESLGFEAALEAEAERLQGEREKMLADESYVSFEHQHFSYLAKGIYVDQLLDWSKFFHDDQMLVLKSEDYFERPREVLKPVLDLLDLPEWEPETWETRNKGSYEQRIDSDTRQRLSRYFAPHNERLYDYLGIDFGW